MMLFATVGKTRLHSMTNIGRNLFSFMFTLHMFCSTHSCSSDVNTAITSTAFHRLCSLHSGIQVEFSIICSFKRMNLNCLSNCTGHEQVSHEILNHSPIQCHVLHIEKIRLLLPTHLISHKIITFFIKNKQTWTQVHELMDFFPVVQNSIDTKRHWLKADRRHCFFKITGWQERSRFSWCIKNKSVQEMMVSCKTTAWQGGGASWCLAESTGERHECYVCASAELPTGKQHTVFLSLT